MKIKSMKQAGMLLFLGLSVIFLLKPAETKAGVINSSSEVTYKEYWIPHSQFTGGCGDSEKPFGSWYLEVWGCEKTLAFEIPDDFSSALKAEIYIDFWRNIGKHARFSLNGGQTYAPNTGSAWSRTPYIGEIPLTDLRLGANTLLFSYINQGGYHVHDVAIRIYYDDAHPLVAGPGSDVTPPDGALVSIKGDGAEVGAGTGGNLAVNNNQLTLKANVSGGAKFVEFHSYYFGYDEDVDGQWRDWHNRNHNNWNPGGTAPKATGGSIDHPGTKATPSAGEYSINWNISHIADQDDVRFKIRVVDASGNVREAAGGISNKFALSRTKPLIALWVPGFSDAGLWMEGKKPVSVNRNFKLPNDFDGTDYDSGKMVHSFWHGAYLNLNGHSKNIWPNFPVVGGKDDHWQLSIANLSPEMLWPGNNVGVYNYNNPGESRPGAFVEKPGPMFILERKAWAVDNSAPTLYGQKPAPNETDVGAGTNIQFQLLDDQTGLDYDTIKLKVQGQDVSPSISGAKHSALLIYRPPIGFESDEEVVVNIEACDLGGKCINITYSFDIEGESLPTGISSDDFNGCSLNESIWEFRDPVGNASYKVNGAAIEMTVPAGSNHDLWEGANDAARIMQPANDADFRVRAKFNSAVEEKYQMQGFLVAKDEQNFLRFSMRHDGIKAYLEIYIFESGVPLTRLDLPLDEAQPYVVPTNLAVERFGNTWKYLYLDSDEVWKKVKSFDYALDVAEVGLFVGNKGIPASSAPEFTSSIDFFFDDAAPIDPQDQNPLYLPVEVIGQGVVEKSKQCGNPVTLTATPAEGSFFQGWSSKSGAISGRTNPLPTNFTVGEVVSATFHIDALMLEVEVDNDGSGDGGSVSKSPDQAIYNFQDKVTLSAEIPVGWDFKGWSGDIKPGDENKNPLVITMDDDINLTASFEAQPVTLETNVEGMGSVDADPDQGGNYQYGDLVKLTADPDDGWVFDHWEGDQTGFTNPLNLVLKSDIELTAVFKERPPWTFFPIVIK